MDPLIIITGVAVFMIVLGLAGLGILIAFGLRDIARSIVFFSETHARMMENMRGTIESTNKNENGRK